MPLVIDYDPAHDRRAPCDGAMNRDVDSNMADFDISRASGACCVTGRAFDEDETFYTVVLETEDGLARRDYSLDAWTGTPEGALCFYKTRMPHKNQPKRRFIDDSAMISFFKALGDTTHPNKLRFRFVLALILLRKRVLKYERTLREGDAEIWEMRLVREKSMHRVVNPVLREDEIAGVSAELGSILHGFVVDEVEANADGAGADSDGAHASRPAEALCEAGVSIDESQSDVERE